MTITEAINSFILTCRADGLAERTVESYQIRLRPLAKQFGQVPVASITTENLRAYVAGLYESDRSVYTVHGHIRALKRFFRWLVEEGVVASNPSARIRLPRLPESPPKAISDEDLARILRAAMESGEKWEQKRNVALILFLADTGCRLSGLLSLQVSQLDLTTRTARISEKGGQWRFAFLLPTTAKAMADWLEVRTDLVDGAADTTDAVWVAKDGHPLTRWGIQSILRRLKKRGKVQGPAGAHSFRHRFAIQYLLNGGDLASLADLLGHRDVETTKQFYARFQISELREKHDQFSPARSIVDMLEI